MVELVHLFFKNPIILRRRKKSLLVLKLLVSVCAMVYGIYIYSTYLKHIHIEKKKELFEFQVIKTTSHHNNVVYPKPKTVTRYTRNPMRFFVIVSMQRSGSGWFETLLNSHTNISSNGEIFGQKNRRQNISSIINTLDRVYGLKLITSSSKKDCSTAVGFKWMLNQGLMEHRKEILKYFVKRGVSVIFFLRRNMLRRLASVLANSFDKHAKVLNGIHVSHVHSHEEALRLSRFKPTIDVTLLELELGKMESTAMKALKYFNTTKHIIVYYEDLIKNPYKLTEVEYFLTLPQMKLSSRQVKIHKGPLSEHITNWEDVNKTLSGTMYDRYLKADY